MCCNKVGTPSEIVSAEGCIEMCSHAMRLGWSSCRCLSAIHHRSIGRRVCRRHARQFANSTEQNLPAARLGYSSNKKKACSDLRSSIDSKLSSISVRSCSILGNGHISGPIHRHPAQTRKPSLAVEEGMEYSDALFALHNATNHLLQPQTCHRVWHRHAAK